MDENKLEWNKKVFQEKAVLCFPVTKEKVLLIRKKKGFGAGKLVAPGGHIEPGETEEEAITRELKEEIGLIPINLKKKAELFFSFQTGYSFYTSVFISTKFKGHMKESDEAIPYWFSKQHIPYDQMWDDNPFWVPLILADKSLKGYFLYNKDEKMINRKVIKIKG